MAEVSRSYRLGLAEEEFELILKLLQGANEDTIGITSKEVELAKDLTLTFREAKSAHG